MIDIWYVYSPTDHRSMCRQVTLSEPKTYSQILAPLSHGEIGSVFFICSEFLSLLTILGIFGGGMCKVRVEYLLNDFIFLKEQVKKKLHSKCILRFYVEVKLRLFTFLSLFRDGVNFSCKCLFLYLIVPA